MQMMIYTNAAREHRYRQLAKVLNVSVSRAIDIAVQDYMHRAGIADEYEERLNDD